MTSSRNFKKYFSCKIIQIQDLIKMIRGLTSSFIQNGKLVLLRVCFLSNLIENLYLLRKIASSSSAFFVIGNQ